jgi:hypothetical protein
MGLCSALLLAPSPFYQQRQFALFPFDEMTPFFSNNPKPNIWIYSKYVTMTLWTMEDHVKMSTTNWMASSYLLFKLLLSFGVKILFFLLFPNVHSGKVTNKDGWMKRGTLTLCIRQYMCWHHIFKNGRHIIIARYFGDTGWTCPAFAFACPVQIHSPPFARRTQLIQSSIAIIKSFMLVFIIC